MDFTLEAACYSLTTSVDPADGGAVNMTTANCADGKYTAGTVVQLSAVPAAGFSFLGWSGGASGSANPISITMDADKSVTASFRGVKLLSPSGTMSIWNNIVSWTGATGATSYQLEIYDANTNARLFKQWLTATATGCNEDLSCDYLPSGVNLTKGDYKWRVQHYGTSYGYGLWTPFMNFTLTSPGALDTKFNYGTGTRGTNNFVYALAVQPDGKVILGGPFNGYNGVTTPRGVIRLNTDGSLDASFNPGGAGIGGGTATVYALAVDAAGNILVGGNFNQYNGVSVPSGLVRLTSTGALDTTFNNGGAGISGGWVSDTVYAIAVQPANGKIVVGGDFTAYNGDSAAPDLVLRVNADGSRDSTGFISGAGTGILNTLYPACGRPVVYALALQPADGKILVGGNCFNAHNNDGVTNDLQASDNFQRLNTDGTLDTSFNYGSVKGLNAAVRAIAVQLADGKIVLGGLFTGYNGDLAAPDDVLRVDTDGSRDTGFIYGAGSGVVNTSDPSGDAVYALAVQPDGKIIVAGGLFNAFSNDGSSNDTQAPDNLLRLNANGTLDTGFNYGSGVRGANATIRALAIQPGAPHPYNVKAWFGGSMSSYNQDTNAPDGIERLDY
jgi:uncharacterized delta-60 repeat protein